MEAAASKENPARVLIVSSTAATNVPHIGEHGTIMYSTSKAAANVSASTNSDNEVGLTNK
jgi:hypothetical protein